jgi:predicted nuclease of predicted toxin-antitoxin system
MAILYANENFPFQVVVALRQRGHDVLTVREAGQDNQRIDDPAVLAFATTAKRVLITLNRRDFMRLHRQQPDHAGIVVCTEDPDVEGQAQRMHDAIKDLPTVAGLLIRVNRPSP